jgi:endonuclease/exonuclease/phosphatase (EEP) superfamily protein YafD
MPRENPAPKRPTRGRQIVKIVFLTAVGVTSVCSILGLAGRSALVFLYLDQPRVHYLAFLLVSLGIVLFLRWWRVGIAIGFFVAVNLYLLWPVAWPSQAAKGAPAFSVVHVNMGKQAEVPGKLVQFLLDWRPELLFLQEVTPELAAELPTAVPQYIVLASEPRSDTRGVAVLACADLPDGFQVHSARVGRFAEELTDRPHVELAVSRDNVRFRLLGFHCSRPRNTKTIGVQAAEYEALAAWFRQSASTHSVAIGDFNATPWSQTVRHFLRRAALPTAQSGFSLAPTWPAGAVGLLGVPIDLVTHSAGLQVETEIGPDIGSDHYPILCRVTAADQAEPHPQRANF